MKQDSAKHDIKLMNRADLQLPLTRFDYQDKLVIVTGGAAGIGRCISLSFAANGAKVIILDRDQEACRETFELGTAHDFKHDIIWLAVDLAKPEAVNQAVSDLRSSLDRSGLSVLINNAAIANAHTAHLESEDAEDFDKVLSVNLRAPFLLSRLMIPWLRQASGNIINIASTRAYMSEANSEGYGASKGGVVALTHAMAVTLGKYKLRVNSVSPGWIATEQWQKGMPPALDFSEDDHNQHPAGRVGRPADIAAACLYLGSDDAGFITGVNLTVDGGMTHKMIYI